MPFLSSSAALLSSSLLTSLLVISSEGDLVLPYESSPSNMVEPSLKIPCYFHHLLHFYPQYASSHFSFTLDNNSLGSYNFFCTNRNEPRPVEVERYVNLWRRDVCSFSSCIFCNSFYTAFMPTFAVRLRCVNWAVPVLFSY